jgi:hypothetical protein
MLRLFVSISILACASLSAQTTTGLIFGTVADSSGGVLPNAQVAAVNTGTQERSLAVTNEQGSYVFPALFPGAYAIEVEAPGFRKHTRTSVRLEVNQRARVDVQLELGSMSEAVSVSADATNVDTFSSTIKEVVDSQRIVDLPLNGRNALQLQALLPGAIQVQSGQAASAIALNTSMSFAINGTRGNASSYMLDGGLNMDMYNNLATAFPNPDALQEFSILQNNYSAAYGRNAGAVINMVTKSGTNQFHGTVYEFLRNTRLNTRNFFAPERAPLKRNQFGGTVGGRIVRDKTFFFTSYEGMRERSARTNSGTIVPTALERRGDFSESRLGGGRTFTIADPATVTAQNPQGTPFPGNVIPQNRLDPVAVRFAEAFLPLPNSPGNAYAYNLSIPQDDNQGVGKLDQLIGDNHRISLRYFFDDFYRINNDGLLLFNSQFNWATHNATLNDTHTFSPNVTNVATITFNRNTFIRSPLDTPAGASSWAELGCVSCPQLAPPGIPEHWNVSINNGFGVRSSTGFFSYMQNLQVIDNLSVVRGGHLLSIGGEISRSRRNGREFFNSAPVFNFNGQRSGASGYGYADFFLGAPVSVQQNTPLRSYPIKWTPFLYFQDDWKAHRRLTLNLGLRWAPYLPVFEQRDEFSAFRPGRQSTVFPLAPEGMVFVGDQGIGRGVVDPDYKKLEPRFGFAWDVFGDGRTSVRGGYGVFYDTLRMVAINNFSTRQPFTLGLTTNDPHSLSDPYRNHPQNLQALLSFYNSAGSDNRAGRAFVRRVQMNSIDPDFTTGYMQQWNVSIQREVFRNFVATVAYVGSKGTDFQMTQELNPAVYIPGQSTPGNIDQRRRYSDYERIQNLQSNAFSTYNSLQVSFRQRFSGGLSLLGSYVWSKFIDLASNDGNGSTAAQGSNPFNWFADKGLSDFDVPHRFVTSFIWEVPFLNTGNSLKRTLLGGWQINGIVTLQSGSPFSVSAGENRSLAGGAGDRADLLYTPAVYSDRSRGEQVARYFETEAFGQPALGTFGTSGRNILRGPGLANFDTALFKEFHIAEGRRFELRWEVFNALNRPNFFNPVSSRTNSAFGRITSARDPRIMQVAAKFVF